MAEFLSQRNELFDETERFRTPLGFIVTAGRKDVKFDATVSRFFNAPNKKATSEEIALRSLTLTRFDREVGTNRRRALRIAVVASETRRSLL